VGFHLRHECRSFQRPKSDKEGHTDEEIVAGIKEAYESIKTSGKRVN
jgi:hypothetical protein